MLQNGMDVELKKQLARFGRSDKEAAAVRLRAARKVAKLSQDQLGELGGVKKSSISNMEHARAFPNRAILIHLFDECRIDANFMLLGHFAQLPGDVQEALFLALESESNLKS